MVDQIVTPTLLRAWPLSEPGEGKQARGSVLVLAGGRTTPGAALLAGEAALRAGAGRLAIATAASAAPALAVAVPEARVVDLPEDDDGEITPDAADRVVEEASDVDVLLAGPGFADPRRALALLEAVLPQATCPLVLDALGTAFLTEHPDGLDHLEGRVVVNANPTELAKMLRRDDCPPEQVGAAVAELAGRSGVVVLGGATEKHVAEPGGRSWVVQGGGPGLGVSGSGDVQAGIVAGLLAREQDAAQAAVWGAYLHARAGERLAGSVGRVGFLARELPAVVPAVLGELA